MYLVSLYFDEQTNKTISKLMKSVASKCGNNYMFDKNIPPHLTIASVEEGQEAQIIQALDACIENWQQGKLDFVAIGSFKPHVLFLTPVLNEYLHKLSIVANDVVGASDSKYLPFNWLPHTTIARTLSEEQMLTAFRVLQANFTPFSGRITSVGLAKNRPHQDIRIWHLPSKND